MNNLVHEIWETVSDGMILHDCCFAGPRGDGHRKLLEPGSRLIATFEAESHFKAMTYYHEYLGREIYTTRYIEDHEPYPQEWITEQQNFLNSINSENNTVSHD